MCFEHAETPRRALCDISRTGRWRNKESETKPAGLAPAGVRFRRTFRADPAEYAKGVRLRQRRPWDLRELVNACVT